MGSLAPRRGADGQGTSFRGTEGITVRRQEGGTARFGQSVRPSTFARARRRGQRPPARNGAFQPKASVDR